MTAPVRRLQPIVPTRHTSPKPTAFTLVDEPPQPMIALFAIVSPLTASPGIVVASMDLLLITSLDKSPFIPQLTGTGLPDSTTNVAKFAVTTAAASVG